MKNIKLLLIGLIAAFALTSCDDKGNDEPAKKDIVGEWHMTAWSGAVPNADIYVNFKADGTFDLYQKLYTLDYEHLNGTYTYDKKTGLLTGEYQDNTPWIYSYTATATSTKLTLTSKESPDDISVYTKESIPSSVTTLSVFEANVLQSRGSEGRQLFL